MNKDLVLAVAGKYYVEEMDGALILSSRLYNILSELELNKNISNIALEYLLKKKLLALHRYAKKEITFNEFSEIARIEQSKRRMEREENELKVHAQRKIEEDAYFVEVKKAQLLEAQRKIAFDKDPKNIAKAKQRRLKDKYGICVYIEDGDFAKLMDILRIVDNGIRLSEDQFLWLSTESELYFTEELKKAHHFNEAKFFEKQYIENKDPWSAVNASSHFRKCGRPKDIEPILRTIDVFKLKDVKLKSALCTTHGGVKRDLEKWDESIKLAEQAYQFTPKKFQPCTLLGAVNIEIGNYDLGYSWYKKAVERGFKEHDVDRELIGIYKRAEKSKKEEMRTYLLNLDPDRYSWANKH